MIECRESSTDNATSLVNNFGLPGLIDLPSAQRLPDGELVLTQQISDTLARTGISSQILPSLGVAFRFSGHGKNGDEANERTNHDRSFDAHLTVIKEGKYRPAISIGLRDFIGTGWYSSEYIAATKTFEKLEITAGLGFGGYVFPPAASSNATEEYDGSSWTSVNNMSDARQSMSSFGTQTAAIAAAGYSRPTTSNLGTTLSYDGTNWTALSSPANVTTTRSGLALSLIHI